MADKIVEPTERFGVYAEHDNERRRTSFIAVTPDGRFVTRMFPGLLSKEAAIKAWKHQRHLFRPTRL